MFEDLEAKMNFRGRNNEVPSGSYLISGAVIITKTLYSQLELYNSKESIGVSVYALPHGS